MRRHCGPMDESAISLTLDVGLSIWIPGPVSDPPKQFFFMTQGIPRQPSLQTIEKSWGHRVPHEQGQPQPSCSLACMGWICNMTYSPYAGPNIILQAGLSLWCLKAWPTQFTCFTGKAAQSPVIPCLVVGLDGLWKKKGDIKSHIKFSLGTSSLLSECTCCSNPVKIVQLSSFSFNRIQWHVEK